MALTKFKKMHVLQIVIKNTSTLDFTLPVLWKLRQKHPDIKISILYTSLSKNQILRQSNFMEDFCKKHQIDQYDFCDFFPPRFLLLKKLVNRLFKNSYSDKLEKEDLTKFSQNNIAHLLETMLLGFRRPIERILTKSLVNTDQILPSLQPDVILFDNRSVSNFVGRDDFFRYMETQKKPVVLLPHAPHYIGSTSEFCRFDEMNDCLMPEYTEHWMPFKYGQPWKVVPRHKHQFKKIGYPGFDGEWWHFLKDGVSNNDKIRCLVLTRKFLPESKVREDGFDEATLDYNETLDFLKALRDAIRQTGLDIEVVVKPHPSGSRLQNEKVFHAAGFEEYEINYESFYQLLPRIHLVVAQFSTSLALPIAYGIPTMLVETKLQHSVHRRWPLLAELYLNLQYYSLKSDVITKFEQMTSDYLSGNSNSKDRKLIEKFYEPDPIGLAVARVEALVGICDGSLEKNR